jgi:hypothetical protein
MKTPFILSQILAFSLTLSAPLQAAPGDGVTDSQPRLEILNPTGSCAPAGALCITAGAATTVVVPPPVVIAAPPSQTPQPPAPPQFARVMSSAVRGADPLPWIVEVQANLRQPALTGNALFLIYDAQDPGALANHEVTALLQGSVVAGSRIAARLPLSPEDGFRAGRYLIQVAQIINGKEVVLADGELRLQ